MSYYNLLGLSEEPFSTSPDPNFFYQSPEHKAALLRLMIEIRLRRGLSIVLGDIGLGKTTLSRKLFLMIKERTDILFHMILDPSYVSEELFLESLVRTFSIKIKKENPTILDFKEAIRSYLFKNTVEKGKTVVLLIDEAQKLSPAALEALRLLLNYETNEQKLLQLILLGQLELSTQITSMRNLWERINYKYALRAFNEQEVKDMITFRLRVAGYGLTTALFSDEAYTLIHQSTQGYPRRIAMLAHAALKELVLNDRQQVDTETIQAVLEKEASFCEMIKV